MNPVPLSLILDSGAYSAWTQQKPFALAEYLTFIEKNYSYFNHVVNLDVIPGKLGGGWPSNAEVEASAEEGHRNALELRQHNIDVIPVYHMGERRYWLEKMIGDGFTYIGISPANNRKTVEKQVWLDEVYSYLCGSKGYPTVKTHGFGVTALPLLYRYPWFSVDSITWVMVAAYGGILMPMPKPGGGYDYSVAPQCIFTSRTPTKQSYKIGKHYDVLGPDTQAFVRGYIEKQGFTVDQMRDEYLLRQRFNCRFFKAMAASYTLQPFFARKSGLFNTGNLSSSEGQVTPINPHVVMVFTVNLTKQHSTILQEEGIQNRLMSYWYFRDGKGLDLKHYSETGMVQTIGRTKKVKVKR